ncbi:unnamed protein product, partial [Prorocentrum cordatum]
DSWGGSNEPDAFMKVHNHQLEQWRADAAATHTSIMLQPCASTWDPEGPVQDLSRQVFVDDILKFHIAPRVGPRKQAMDSNGQLRDASIDKLHALTATIERNLDALRHSLHQGGFSLNETKEEIAHCIPSKYLHRAFFTDPRINCRRLTAMKHVGGMFDAKATFNGVREARLRAANAGWCQYRHFWFSRAPRRLKRSVFQAVVYEAAISPAETYYLYDTDYKKLDTCLGKKLRAMLQGKGCHQHRDSHHKAISAAERVSALFGELRIESLLRDNDLPAVPRTLTDDGYISPDARPTARQFATDIQDLLTYDIAEPLDLLDWKGSIAALFTDAEIAGAFCGIDVSFMRVAYLRCAIAPPDVHRLGAPTSSDSTAETEMACPTGDAELDDQKIDPKKAPLARVRRRRRAAYKPKVAPKIPNDMRELLTTIVRATYQNTKQIRELKGRIITAVKISDTDPLVEAIEQENRNHARAIRREGESHGRGPPAPGAAMAMMEALTQQDIGAKSKGDLTTTIERINAMDQHQVQDSFPICKLDKAYKSGQANILFNCRGYEIRQRLMTALRNADKQACVGPAPAGFVEDELTLWMGALVG